MFQPFASPNRRCLIAPFFAEAFFAHLDILVSYMQEYADSFP